jgi:peptidoglycan/xylan/chitin deacetylase (PgdA/CDA1 family)
MLWRMPKSGKRIYLTFDDGPDEDVTPAILEILKRYEVKATFFCVGKKVNQHPELMSMLQQEGHSVGNHTFSHLKGKKTNDTLFLQDTEKGNEQVGSSLFRPPYGSITRSQIKKLKEKYKIVMWTLLPGDFDPRISIEKCLKRSIKYTMAGTIIVFHDNKNIKEKVLYVVPKFIEHFQNLGYTFEAL